MSVRILHGDCRDVLRTLPDASVHCCVTSPPYWGLRDYGHAAQLGLEATPDAYVAELVAIFREVRRVLRDDGTLWLNLGDSYASDTKGTGGPSSSSGLKRDGRPEASRQRTVAREKLQTAQRYPPREFAHGLKPKDLVGIPWMVAFALQADGWWLRSDIVWAKPNPMPESITDRPTKAHEYVFLLAKSVRYFYDADAVREPATTPGGRSGNLARVFDDGSISKRPANHLGRSVPWDDDGAGRNMRSVWTIATRPYAEAHFATFPPTLAERCLLAGTSARGCCATCGAPWARVTERHGIERAVVGKARDKVAAGLRTQFSGAAPGTPTSPRIATLGWLATCDHAGPPVPCTVLDPFGGSGTVGRVADDHGRHAVLVELNADYVALAEQRCAQQGLFAVAPLVGAGGE